jgi:hypothetical protein
LLAHRAINVANKVWIRLITSSVHRLSLAVLITASCALLAQTTVAQQYQVSYLEESLGGTRNRGNSINNRGWIAGFSFLTGNQKRHAALWRDGLLNDPDHLAPGFNGFIINAQDINDEGEITGRAFDPATGAIKTFIAVPVLESASSKQKAPSTVQAKIVLPKDVRQTILQDCRRGNALLQ